MAYAQFLDNDTDLSDEAAEKLEMAKTLGNNYYSQPYIALAKLALRRGDEPRCLDILKECKVVFSSDYYVYDFAEVLRDEEFRDIWPVLNDL